VDAGIPSVQVCAGCHIPGGAPLIAADSAGVQKLIAYWREQRPIPWERIYKVPGPRPVPAHAARQRRARVPGVPRPVETMQEIEDTVYGSRCDGLVHQLPSRARSRTDCFVCHY
jgi:hypothetical protein